jgi:hypothetical protein
MPDDTDDHRKHLDAREGALRGWPRFTASVTRNGRSRTVADRDYPGIEARITVVSDPFVHRDMPFALVTDLCGAATHNAQTILPVDV